MNGIVCPTCNSFVLGYIGDDGKEHYKCSECGTVVVCKHQPVKLTAFGKRRQQSMLNSRYRQYFK